MRVATRSAIAVLGFKQPSAGLHKGRLDGDRRGERLTDEGAEKERAGDGRDDGAEGRASSGAESSPEHGWRAGEL